MNSTDRLPEIQDRAAKATSGWQTSDTDPGVVLSADGQPIGVFGGSRQDHHDATFTAHARKDVPWLLDLVRRLQGEVDSLAAEKAVIERDCAELEARLTERLDALQASNESAYRELYDAMNGPHFCPGQPFGQTATAEQVTA
ncbi:hypothetical protein [Streptomyces sp. NPDC002402]